MYIILNIGKICFCEDWVRETHYYISINSPRIFSEAAVGFLESLAKGKSAVFFRNIIALIKIDVKQVQ